MLVRALLLLLVMIPLIAPLHAAPIHGEVTVSSGSLPPSLVVSLFAPETRSAQLMRLMSAAPERKALATQSVRGGSFSLDLPGTLNVILVVEAPGFAPLSRRVDSGEDVGTLVLLPAGSRDGEVMAGQRPVPNALVAWMAESGAEVIAHTDAKGHYSVLEPAAWADRFLVIHPSFAPLFNNASDVTERQKRLHQELSSGVRVQGRVQREGDGEPVSGASIFVDSFRYATSDGQGRFEIPHAHENFQAVHASGKGSAGWGERSAQGLWTVTLRPDGSLKGTVRDEKGRGIPWGVVEAFALRRGVSQQTFADAAGRFQLDGMPRAAYSVDATAPGFASVRNGGDLEEQAADLRVSRTVTRDITLRRLATLHGKVIDEDGHPVLTARVVSPALVALRPIWTDAKGEFDLPVPAWATSTDVPESGRRKIEFSVRKDGYAAAFAEFDPFDLRAQSIVLRRGIAVRLTAQNRKGEPVPAVITITQQKDQLTPLRVLAPLEGSTPAPIPLSSLSIHLEPGVYQLNAAAEGYATRTQTKWTVDSASQVTTLVLEAAATVRGRVVRADGTAVGDTQIMLRGAGEEVVQTETATDGSFAVNTLSAGRYQLFAYKEDEFIREVRTIDAPDANVLIKLAPSSPLQGRVLDRLSLSPLHDFTISVTSETVSEGADEGIEKTFHDEAGGFSIAHVPDGKVRIEVRAEGYVASSTNGIAVGAGRSEPLEIRMDSGLALHGTVQTASGSPLADVAVSVDRRESDEEGSLQTSTDEQGEYRLSAVPAGPAMVVFRKRGFVAAREELTLTASRDLNVILEEGLQLHGVVRSASAPLGKVSITANSAAARAEVQYAESSVNGEFSLKGLSAARYTITASRAGYVRAELADIDPLRTTPLIIDLKKATSATLHGTVTGIGSEDVRSRSVMAYSTDGSALGSIDEQGHYRVENAPTGEIKVIARVEEHSRTRSSRAESITLEAGDDREVNLSLSDGVTARGRITRGGLPLLSASISFSRGEYESYASTESDADGRYEIGGLEPGRYAVRIDAIEARNGFETTAQLQDDVTLDFDIPTSSVHGRVVDASNGEPLTHASISISRLERGEGQPLRDYSALTTDSTGRFVAAALSDGSYRAVAQRSSYGQQLQEFQVSNGVTEELLFRLTPSNDLRVSLLDARDGLKLSGVIVARDQQRRVVFHDTPPLDRDGASLISLAPGEYLLSASATGYASRTIPVRVPSSGAVELPLTPGGTLQIASTHDLRGEAKLIGATGEEYVRCWCNGIAQIALTGRKTLVENVEPGSYELRLLDPNGAKQASFPVTITEGNVAVIQVP